MVSLIYLVILFTLIVCGLSEITKFRRLRQEIEVSKDGVINVYIRVLDYNSSFELELEKRQVNVFTDNHIVDNGKEELSISPEYMYSGVVKNHPNSIVSGSIHDNAFEGSVYVSDEQHYHIENGKRLFGPQFCLNDMKFCYVIYSPDDVGNHSIKKRSADAEDDNGIGMCGWHSKRIKEILLKQLGEAYPAKPADVPEAMTFRYKRRKREANDDIKICTLFMQADPKLWELYLNDYNNDEVKARTQLLKYFSQIIQGVNDIYLGTAFKSADGSYGPYTNVQFKIARTAIYTREKICSNGGTDPVLYELCRDNIDSAEFLNINSKMNHDNFCLAYLMTHRQFSEGVQGLAWVGYPKTYAGGICQKNAVVKGHKSSYNTGIVTSNNYGKRSPIGNLILTTAHEIGHNFGSPHDKAGECQPGGAKGNYIMYPYVTPGNKPNNDDFSPCSHNTISANLNAVLNEVNANKKNCMLQALGPICGNGIVEGDETCDCGYSYDCTEKCCIPADQPNACRLRTGATCSPSNGVCCDANTCSLLTPEQAVRTQCRPATECSLATACSSTSASCPRQDNLPDGTLCWESSKVCTKGQCSQPLCSLITTPFGQSYEICQESIPDDETSFERYCFLSCKPPNSTKCINSASVTSASVDPLFYNFLLTFNGGTNLGQPIRLGSGSPCDEYKGFCDVFYKCRKVNSQGPLASLFSLLSGEKEPETVAEWLVAHWWVVALCTVAFVVIILIVTQCLARCCLPSSNPKKHKRRTAGDACRRTMCIRCKNAKVESSNNH